MPATPFVGQIMPAGFGIIPKGWVLCNGALLAISANQALFSLIGTTYGGDGIRTFALPDLRGRAVLGCNFNNVPWGLVSGTENVTLNVQQLPSHNHMIQATTVTASSKSSTPTSNIFGVTTTGNPVTAIFTTAGSQEVPLSVSTNVVNDGGNLAHNNMQPFLVINYLIATQGIFPSRP
ncbi:phage tail protein [Bradyrhizobium sp. U87765 SZCCT0131]|uniref:phage tail protein n=1 Tax=unclassified Bradyrhizobium TaxID=2631580 RepID=UPI001BA5FD76|nr:MULTISPECIES: tail fiber protein [unclassified Bradyrhizobium]MBR1220308.1 phage tail protein [Bradyrhizobium sp. U87765 SZCCT0131]MBR1263237.1 phage tail protein [Bradyrhizobium sp. U87765 SZCCT0134]MBR1306880.1 phage tail protein [Bradyrhizobium sp. U87765 SZCCT0110]MBR1323379.1 phage tail protein [Bradyrhizobium sp. U87765 SZCCT0109]MBR1345834.1 phage tail protein [Bradyrhizobium sp. U87765 SZCCT0048]